MLQKDDINKKIAQIDSIISRFDSGEIDLSESVQEYKKALEILQSLQSDFDELKNEIKVLNKDFSLDSSASSEA